MNRILKTGSIKGILFFAALILLFLFIQNEMQKPRPSLFGPQWNLEEFQHYFVGDLPKTASNINYQSFTSYGLLSFKASPSDAMAFAKRFCYGTLLEGYDPFNSIDNKDSNTGDLIQTDPEYFYYSHSINNLSTQLGNRCNDINRGGLHQIVVYTNDANLYEVKLEISATCTNPNAPHPCDGIPVSYTSHGAMELGKSYMVTGRYAEGDSWEITLEPNKQYRLVLKSKDTQQSQSSGDVQVSVFPISISSGNEPYCETCWAVTHPSSQNDLEISFAGPPSRLARIGLFWLSKDHIYEISVVQNT